MINPKCLASAPFCSSAYCGLNATMHHFPGLKSLAQPQGAVIGNTDTTRRWEGMQTPTRAAQRALCEPCTFSPITEKKGGMPGSTFTPRPQHEHTHAQQHARQHACTAERTPACLGCRQSLHGLCKAQHQGHINQSTPRTQRSSRLRFASSRGTSPHYQWS